jgi:hypothetical protein
LPLSTAGPGKSLSAVACTAGCQVIAPKTAARRASWTFLQIQKVILGSLEYGNNDFWRIEVYRGTVYRGVDYVAKPANKLITGLWPRAYGDIAVHVELVDTCIRSGCAALRRCFLQQKDRAFCLAVCRLEQSGHRNGRRK